MNKVLVAVAVLIPLLLCYQEAAAVVIDFDSLVNTGLAGDIAGDAFVGQGIIFSTPDLVLNLGSSIASKPNCLGADPVGGEPFSGGVFFKFTGNQISNDLQFRGGSPFGDITATAFNINDVIVSVKNISPASGTLDFSGFSVHRVEVTGNTMCIDDVSFNLINEQPGDGGANDKIIGGKIILLDSTGLLLAGVATSAFWLIPVTLSSAGLIVYKLRKN